MRIKFLLLSALTGCLILLLGLVAGRSQDPIAPPAEPEQKPRTQLPQSRTSQPGAPSDWMEERFRQLDRNGAHDTKFWSLRPDSGVWRKLHATGG